MGIPGPRDVPKVDPDDVERKRRRPAWRTEDAAETSETTPKPARKSRSAIHKILEPTQAELAAQDEREKTRLAIYQRLESSPIVFMHFFFEAHTRRESPRFHLELMNHSMRQRHLAVAAPRGSAKSTILTFLKPIHAITFKKKRFIVIIQNTFSKAAMSLTTIKKEFLENQILRAHFPGIEITKDAEGDAVFRHPDGFETKVLCRGVDQIGALRGVKHGAYRPDLMIGDDMEDDELVRSAERRRQLQSDFDDALVPAGDFTECQYIFIGTVLHDDSLIAKLVSKDHYEEYAKLFYRARYELPDGTRASLWPEQWSVADLDRMERERPSSFAKEYQNDPVAGMNTRFKREDFRYWREQDGRYFLLDQDGAVIASGDLHDCRAAIACDLAWKEKRENDRSVLMPGFLTPSSEILVWDYIAKRGMRPDEVGEQLFLMVDRLKSLTGSDVPVGFEKAMLENVTQYLLRQKMRERNQYISTQELVWDADKQTRIETRLQPRYAQHVMFHKRGHGDLETELERFPAGAHDDLPDALQGLVQLLKYPKNSKRATEAPDNAFDRMRQLAIDAKMPAKKRRVSGYSHFYKVHAKVSPI